MDYTYLNPHPSLYSKIAQMSYPEARRYLKNLWLKRGEQSEIIRRAREFGDFKGSLPKYWNEKENR